MNDYTRMDFHHYFDKEINARRFYLRVHGTFIEVDKAVYYACYNSYRQQLRDNRRDQKYGLISYDDVLPDGNSVLETCGKGSDLIDSIYKRDIIKAIMRLIEGLDDTDKELLCALLFEGKKESEMAEKYKVSQQAISSRKRKLLKSLQKKVSSGYKKIKALLFLVLCVLISSFNR